MTVKRLDSRENQMKVQIALTSALLCMLALAGNAQTLSLRGGFTGNWTDPVPSRQGVQIEIVDDRRAVVAWFTFDLDGNPTWVFGVGEIENDVLRAEMLRFGNGRFPPREADPDQVTSEIWGTIEIRFSDCGNGQMSWQPVLENYAPGEMTLGRVSAIAGLRCAEGEEFHHVTRFSFDSGPGQWQGLVADFEQPQAELIEFQADWEVLPEPLQSRSGFRLAGSNASDDLAMLLTAPLAGLLPETVYRAELDVTIATRVPAGCFGAGGSPGEGVTVKVGVATQAPEVVSTGNRFGFNFDKGNQTQSGADAIAVGDMTNFQDCEAVEAIGQWQLKTLTTQGQEFTATTDADGRLWLLALTDSGFEGRTTFYITDFVVRLQALG